VVCVQLHSVLDAASLIVCVNTVALFSQFALWQCMSYTHVHAMLCLLTGTLLAVQLGGALLLCQLSVLLDLRSEVLQHTQAADACLRGATRLVSPSVLVHAAGS
jgi:hypothetical protein